MYLFNKIDLVLVLVLVLLLLLVLVLVLVLQSGFRCHQLDENESI